MKTRKPRPPVGQQGASRAYLEGRLDGPEAHRTTPRSRLEWYGVWSAVAGASAGLTVGFAFDVTHPHAFYPTYLLLFASSPLSAVYLRPWSRSRPEPRRGDRIAVGACATLVAAWLACVVLADFVWHATGEMLFVALASTGFVSFFALVVVSYRARFAPWRRSRAATDQPIDEPMR